MPTTHLRAKTRAAAAVTAIDSRSACAITGIMTFRSRLPFIPAIAMVASWPITSAATWFTASGITGFTFPGMMLEPDGEGAERARGLDGSVAVLHRLEAVRRGHEGDPGRARQLRRDLLPEAGGRVQSGAEGGAADRQLGQVTKRRLHARDAVADDARVATELLPERHGDRVLEVRAAGLHHVGEGAGALLESRRQLLERRQQRARDLAVGGHVDGGREDVVGALALVHVVVRVDDGLVAAPGAEQLEGAVRDHLVGVHVGRGAGAGLEDVDHELAVELPLRHLRRSAADGVGKPLVEEPERGVDARARALDGAQGGDEAPWEAQPGDREVLDRPRRLRAVVSVRGHHHLTHAVALDAGLGHGSSRGERRSPYHPRIERQGAGSDWRLCPSGSGPRPSWLSLSP